MAAGGSVLYRKVPVCLSAKSWSPCGRAVHCRPAGCYKPVSLSLLFGSNPPDDLRVRGLGFFAEAVILAACHVFLPVDPGRYDPPCIEVFRRPGHLPQADRSSPDRCHHTRAGKPPLHRIHLSCAGDWTLPLCLCMCRRDPRTGSLPVPALFYAAGCISADLPRDK